MSFSRDEFSKKQLELFEQLKKVNSNPQSSLMLCSCFLEWCCNLIIQKCCKNDLLASSFIPLKSKILLLHELGIIDDSLRDDINLLIEERNRAVHVVSYQFDYSIKGKLKYPQTATKPDVEELNQSKIPWVIISLYLLSQMANIVYAKYFR